MKTTIAITSLCALALGCASTGAAVGPQPSAFVTELAPESQTVRVYPRFRWGSERSSTNWPAANWRYYLTYGQTDSGELAIDVCSQMRFTGSRIDRDSCSRNNQTAISPWLLSFDQAAEYLVAVAVAKQVEAGTLDLEARPLFVDIGDEYLEALHIRPPDGDI